MAGFVGFVLPIVLLRGGELPLRHPPPPGFFTREPETAPVRGENAPALLRKGIQIRGINIRGSPSEPLKTPGNPLVTPKGATHRLCERRLGPYIGNPTG